MKQIRFFDLIDSFIDDLKSLKGYSDHTAKNYRIDLEQFLSFLVEKQDLFGKAETSPELESVDFLVIREYLGRLFGRYKRTSIARKLSTIRSFFYFLEQKGQVKGNPAADISMPKQGKYIPSHLPIDEMFRLLDGPNREKLLGLRDLAILETLYSCGIRVSELSGLNISSIDFDQRLVRVVGKGNKERIVPIGKKALQAIEDYMESTSSLRKKSGKRIEDTPGRYADHIFPHNPKFPWNPDNFGPLVIPKKGAVVDINIDNLCMYHRIINAYEGNELMIKDSVIYINNQVTTQYTFKMDYFFMMGDNRHSSYDSRFWGFVPQDHIVGAPKFIWLSLDNDKSFPKKIRLRRMLKVVG